MVPNSGDETFAVIRPDEQSWAAITAGLSSVESQLTRAMLWWTAVDLRESQVIPRRRPGRAGRPAPAPRDAPAGLRGRDAQRSSSSPVATPQPDEVAGHLAVIADIARGAVEGGDPALAPGAVTGPGAAERRHRASSSSWLGQDDVDPSVRWAAVHRLAELGDASHIDAEAGARPVGLRPPRRADGARAAVPTAEAKAEMWERLMGGELGNHEFDAVGAGFWGWEQADLVHPYLARYVTDGLALARRSGQAMGDGIGDAFPRLPLTLDVRRELRAAVAAALATGDVPTVLARAWNDALDDLDRTLWSCAVR